MTTFAVLILWVFPAQGFIPELALTIRVPLPWSLPGSPACHETAPGPELQTLASWTPFCEAP